MPRNRLVPFGVLVLLGALVLAGNAVPASAASPTGGPPPMPGIGPSAAMGGWTTYHGGENRTGYDPSLGPSVDTIAWFRCVSPYQIRAGPIADADRLFVGDSFGSVYALDLTHNGSVLWSRGLGGPPVQMDGDAGVLLVATEAGNLTALAEGNGSVLWTEPLGSHVVQGIAVAGADAVVATASGDLRALSVFNGSPAWSIPVGTPAGAPSVDGGDLFVATARGVLLKLTAAGGLLWRSTVDGDLATAPAVDGPDVVVGDLGGNVSDLWSANGSLRWRWNASSAGVVDAVHATPAVAPDRVFVAFDSESVRAFDRSNGSLAWTSEPAYSGYPDPSAVAVTPAGVYTVVNGLQYAEDLDPTTGAPLFQAYLGAFSFTSPALVSGTLFLGEESGCVDAVGSLGAFAQWPVSGRVLNASSGAPVAGAFVSVGGTSVSTDANGGFAIALTNGTYLLSTYATGYATAQTPVTVAGPTPGIVVRLFPLALYPISGNLRDADSGRALPGVVVYLAGPFGFARNATTRPDGSFVVFAPNGSALLTTGADPGYGAASRAVAVDGAPVAGVVLLAPPSAVPTGATGPPWLLAALPLAALLGAAWYAGVRELGRRRVERGLPPAVLSRFSFYVITRVLLLGAQVVFLLALLYIATNVVPAVLSGQPLCATSASGCGGCGWDDLLCTASTIGTGFGQVVRGLFTLQWGTDLVGGKLVEPTTTLLLWWLPNSVELGAIGLGIAMAVAYPVALAAGWRRNGLFDPVARAASLLGLLTPSFLLIVLLVGAVVPTYVHAYGELPYGLLPGPAWFGNHGGQPAWIGTGPRTEPTGFPLVDGVVHRDWAFEQVVLLKNLWQGAILALVYVAVFLRHSWTVAAEASREPHVTAARSRSVPERWLLWRHTGRRVLPSFVLTVALTFPAFLVTQALVESLFFDPGVGYLFLADLTAVVRQPTEVQAGGVLQAALFLVILLTLSVNLLADVVARYLDPRLRTGGT